MEELAATLMKYPEEDRGNQLQNAMPKFLTDYIIFGLIFKHPSFEEEKEWRMLFNPATPHTLSIRAAKHLLIPYGNYSLNDSEGSMPIKEIIIGPNPNVELNKHSLNILLSKNNINCDVKISKIPYRYLH